MNKEHIEPVKMDIIWTIKKYHIDSETGIRTLVETISDKIEKEEYSHELGQCST